MISDEELVKRALENNDCFGEIIDRYEKKLARYLRRLTNLEEQDIEDLLQDVFIKIYRNLSSFDTSFSFSSWAYRITHNEAINCVRKRSGKTTVPLESDEETTMNLIEILQTKEDIKQHVLQKELASNLRISLNKLPKKYKDVIILYYLEDLDYSEISDILQKPMGTIATLLSRAKNKFKDIAKKDKLI